VNKSQLVAIFIGPEPGGAMRPTETVRAVPGLGLEGDRYWQGGPNEPRGSGPDHEVTLIESEAIEALGGPGVPGRKGPPQGRAPL
jgi:hypothetical protein